MLEYLQGLKIKYQEKLHWHKLHVKVVSITNLNDLFNNFCNKLVILLHIAWTQTSLSFPPVLPQEVEEILSQYMNDPQVKFIQTSLK